jgi:hypothetical protein
MRDFIENPDHGDSGWCGDELYIYDGQWGGGWLKFEQYQKRKVKMTGKRDWRVSDFPPPS